MSDTVYQDPEERRQHARYRRVQKAFEAGDYPQVLNLLTDLPANYEEARTIKREAKLGQTLSRLKFAESWRQKLGLSWTLFTVLAGILMIVGLAILAGVGAAVAGSSPPETPVVVIEEVPLTPTPTQEASVSPSITVTTSTIEIPSSEPTIEPEPSEDIPSALPSSEVPEITMPTPEETIDSPATNSEISSPEQEPSLETSEEPVSQPVDSSIPAVPTNLQYHNATQTNVMLSWSNNDQANIVIKRDDQVIAELPANSQNYTDNGLSCGQLYTYTVIATNNAGEAAPAQVTVQAAPCSDPPAPPEALSGKIAVPIFKDGLYHIYLARAENDWIPELLYERASQPAFSTDGRGLVLRSWNHKDWAQRLIYLPDFRDLTSVRWMTDFIEDAHPDLNGNNDIIFHTRREGSPIIVKLGTYPSAETDLRNQIKLGEGENPDWLGSRVIFYAAFPKSGLYLMNEDGSHQELILPVSSKVVPASAPDSDHVAISLNKEGRWQVYTFSVSQGAASLVQLTQANADHYLPTWSPDGNHLAFASNRDNRWAIWVMNADGSNQYKLFDLPGSIDGKISDVSVDPNLSLGWWEERISWAPSN